MRNSALKKIKIDWTIRSKVIFLGALCSHLTKSFSAKIATDLHDKAKVRMGVTPGLHATFFFIIISSPRPV